MHPRLPVLVLLATAPLGAAELIPINDLRFGVTIAQQVRINERVTAPSGAAASYTWEDPKPYQLRYELMYVQGMSRRDRPLGGFAWGLGAEYTNSDVTPDGYSTSSGISSSNSRTDIRLGYREYGLTAVAGYASMPSSTGAGNVDWELLPLLRVGYAKMQSITPGFTASTVSDNSPFWEAGLRGGVVLADEGWVLGLHAEYTFGRSVFDMDMGSTGNSRVTVTRRGFGAGLDIGLRF